MDICDYLPFSRMNWPLKNLTKKLRWNGWGLKNCFKMGDPMKSLNKKHLVQH